MRSNSADDERARLTSKTHKSAQLALKATLRGKVAFSVVRGWD
jgi:hypothetical protein